MKDPDELSRRAPEQRRQAVIAAAEQLFIRHGRDATSIDAIAKHAGVAKGTVYLYFPSKAHIADAIETAFNTRILERLHIAATTAAALGKNPATAWCIELADAYLDELPTHDMLFSRRPATRDATTDHTLVDDLAPLISDTDPTRTRLTAAFLIGGTQQLIDHALTESSTSPRPRLTDTVARLVALATAPEA